MRQKLCTTHSNNYDELEKAIINSLTEICLNYINKDKIKENTLNNLKDDDKVNNKKELEILANDIINDKSKNKMVMKDINKFLSMKEPSRELIINLIDKIEIFGDKNIKIHLTFNNNSV